MGKAKRRRAAAQQDRAIDAQNERARAYALDWDDAQIAWWSEQVSSAKVTDDQLKEQIRLASLHLPLMRHDRVRYIMAIIAASDLVLAVFPAPEQQQGVSMLIVKGQPMMELAISRNKPLQLNHSAFPCTVLEEAHAFRAEYGDGSDQPLSLHHPGKPVS